MGQFVLVVRHGKAGDPWAAAMDIHRPLTEQGKREFRQAAKGLVEIGMTDLDAIYTSPYERCLETAEIMHKAGIGPKPIEVEPLAHDAESTHDIYNVIPAGKNVAIVGHGPHLDHWVIDATGDDVFIKKGGAATVVFPKKVRPEEGKLLWVLTQKQLMKL